MDFGIVDDYVQVADKDAMLMTRRLAREEGLFVGQSSGMAVAGALDWLRANRATLAAEDIVVVLLPDSGFRYLSKTYNDIWMRDLGYMPRTPSLTVEQVLRVGRKKRGTVVAMSPDETLGTAIERMTQHGISQLPVIEGGQVVGSLTENDILNRLIGHPEARDEEVRSVMGAPFPIVPHTLHLEHLSAYLEQGTGAVLVHPPEGEGYDIITKTDLIAALASAGRNGN
jgi:cystathionine beta-synthase